MQMSQKAPEKKEASKFQPCLPTVNKNVDIDGSPWPLTMVELPSKAMEALDQAPHFAPLRTLAHQTPNQVRLLLVSDTLYTATQGVAYLSATMGQSQTRDASCQDDDDEEDWETLHNYLNLLTKANQDAEDESENLFHNQLLTLSVEKLFPIDSGSQSPGEEEKSRLFYRQMSKHAPRVLFHGKGTFLTQSFVSYLGGCSQPVVAVVLAPHQCQLPLMRQLCFEQGFQLCQLKEPSTGYMKQQFQHFATKLHIKLASNYRFGEIHGHLQQMQGARFCDADFVRLLEYVAKRYGDQSTLKTSQLQFPTMNLGRRTAMDELDALIGLGEVKAQIAKLVADSVLSHRRNLAGIPESPVHRNLTFAGNPGTCKSVTARLLAQAMQEAGVGSGAFVEAGREQLIGRYLGHTSPQVAELFEQAKGGVLFIDEAGALVSDSQDCYTHEAINALVRHMELNPETIVIFATYPEEMEALLGENPGLSSRVARNLTFPSYDDHSLCEIFAYQARTQRFSLPQGWEGLCQYFFAQLRKRRGSGFGNGREARRLLHSARGQLALRVTQDVEVALDALSLADLQGAMAELLPTVEASTSSRVIGFGT